VKPELEHPRVSYCDWAQDLEQLDFWHKYDIVLYRARYVRPERPGAVRWKWVLGQVGPRFVKRRDGTSPL
jgi:hypothetical protein